MHLRERQSWQSQWFCWLLYLRDHKTVCRSKVAGDGPMSGANKELIDDKFRSSFPVPCSHSPFETSGAMILGPSDMSISGTKGGFVVLQIFWVYWYDA